jgi:hypothetical protein
MLYKTIDGKLINVDTDEGKLWLRLRIAELLGWTEVEPIEYYGDEYDGQRLVKNLEGVVPDGKPNNRWRLPDWTSNADDANNLVAPDGATCQQWDYVTLDLHSRTQGRNYGCRFVHSTYNGEIQYVVTNSYPLSRSVAWLDYVEWNKLLVDNEKE